MCVWTKKRGSMNAVVLIGQGVAIIKASPCPKSLHGKGEKWIARNINVRFKVTCLRCLGRWP